jgi:hypothetical protein
MGWEIIEGDCLDVMPTLPSASFDAIICDPPYELNFMSRAWDRTGVAFNPATWAEALRVAKLGSHLLAVGVAPEPCRTLNRTSHDRALSDRKQPRSLCHIVRMFGGWYAFGASGDLTFR